jgi:hypothetical protein
MNKVSKRNTKAIRRKIIFYMKLKQAMILYSVAIDRVFISKMVHVELILL